MNYLFFLAGIAGNPAHASLCEKCGECEKACPQNLPIQDTLEEVALQFEGRWFKQTGWLVKKVMGFLRWRDLRRA